MTVNFTGTGLTQSDFQPIATDGASGVALFNDAGTSGSFDGADTPVILAASPNWSGGTTNITLTPATPVALTNGTPKFFYVVIKTSGTIANGDKMVASIPSAGVVTSDGNGPGSTFSAFELVADTTPPQIVSVDGFAGSATVNVKFNKPVQKVGGGALTASDFTYVDGGAPVETISSVAHTPGQNFATLTMSAALDAGDLGGSPATLAAGMNAIADMGGNVLGTATRNFSSPLTINTATIPTATVTTVYTIGSPLVAFAAAGGTPAYAFTPDQAADGTILSNAGLAIVNDAGTYKITGTVLNFPGSYTVHVKATDSTGGTPQVVSRQYTLNIAPAGGGGVPGVTSVTPGGAAAGGSPLTVIVTGANTHFTMSSAVQFLNAGVNDTNITSTVTAATATGLTLTVNVGGGAATGPRDVRVQTSSEVAVMPGGFGVFPAGGAGLNLQNPADAATGINMPPNFNFSPSVNGGLTSYRITVKSTSNFSGAALWDYTFPKPADQGNTNNSHCNSTGCNLGYGAGRFRIITQPGQLSPNTIYYWQVKTYSQNPGDVSDSATPLESTVVRSFTTVSSITDTTPPTIRHRPVFQATASADLNLFARVNDNMAAPMSTPALTASVKYCAGSGCDPATGSTATGTEIGNGYFRLTIPGATINTAGTIVRYFISASDGTNVALFKDMSGNPFQLTSVAAGSHSITGTAHDGAGACPAGIQGATVFADGMGFSATTNGSCAYTLANLPAGTFDLVAVKGGYAGNTINGIPADATGIEFRLPAGFSGGFGGDTSKPHVVFTGPPDNSSNNPGGDSHFSILMAFDKAMSQSSVTAIGNLTVNQVDPSTGGLTDVTAAKGSWAYYPTFSGPGGMPMSNIAIFSLSQTGCSGAPCSLGDGKTIAVIASSSVMDTAGNTVQGNQPNGSYAFTFSTGTTFTGTFTGGSFGAGQFTPPHVTGSTPPPGSLDVPIDRKIVISFSDAMGDDAGSYVLKNFIKLFTVSGGAETDMSSLISLATLDSGKMNAALTLTGSLTASTQYRLKVLGGAKAASGLTVGPPGMETAPVFISDFKTGTGTDTGNPAVTGSFPSDGATNVAVNFGAASVGFSKDMDISTINANTVYLSIGSTTVNGTVEYRSFERQAYFVPQSALAANTAYTLNVTTGVKALNGNPLLTAVTRTFTTGSADAISPTVSFVNADDFSLAVSFSEPMDAAKATDAISFPASVLKAGNYVLKYATPPADSSAGTVITVPATASFSYDQVTNTVKIAGYHDGSITAATLQGKELYVAVTSVKDLSGNSIAANTAKAVIQNSATTQGALGPMGMAGDAFSTAGAFTPANFSTATFGFAPPVDVRPFNTMPGQSTVYGVRVPISRQITSGGTVVLTFPIGFDVSGAKQDVNSPMRRDLNGPGPGVVTFKCNAGGSPPTGASCAGSANADDTGATQGGAAEDGVVVDTGSRSVKVYLSDATNSEGHDFLSIDISGIKNSTVPKDMNTSGYTVDVKTKNGATLLESFTSQPFFIQSGGTGSFTLNGTITATGNLASGTMKVYLMSPLTGPLDAVSTDFGGTANATYSFSGLPTGDYMLSTDQAVAIGASRYVGKVMPERIHITANTTYDLIMPSQSAGGTVVTVNVTGGPANEPMDVFAGSPVGFRVQQITLNGSGAGSATLNLPDGQWNIGVGPQMPKGFAGPPPVPSYLPPRPKNAIIANPTCTVEGAVSCTVTFALANAGKTIKGIVKDGSAGSGLVMANAEVYAYSPAGGMGTRANSDSNGNFVLNVTDGSYVVGAFVPGMPSSKEVPVVVTGAATTYLLIDGATAAITPATAATTFILKVAKPGFTISGKVTDGTSTVQSASVYGYRTDGPGHANVLTDRSGAYTLYVSAGAWKVGAVLPQYGRLVEQTVAVSTANVTNINFSPSQTGGGTFWAVSGTVTGVGAAPLQGAFVRISGNNTNNEATTGATGAYNMKVPACATAGCYTIKAFVPGIGELPPLAAFSLTGDVTKNFSVATSNTVTVTFTASVAKAFVDLFAATGAGAHIDVSNSTTGTVSLADGVYKVQVNVPGAAIGLIDVSGTGYDNSTGLFTVSSSQKALTVTLPTLRTVTGAVMDGTNNIANAWVDVVNPTTGVHFGAQTDATAAPGANFSVKVADGTYFINAMKTGYFRQPTTVVVNGSTPAQTLAMSATTTTISGQVLIGSAGAPNAFVRAEKQGGGFSGAQADATGAYSLPVTSGIWKVYAVADGYQEAAFASNPVDVTGGAAAGKNITLITAITMAPPSSKPMTPASGGTLDDQTAGLKVSIPANALGTSGLAGNVSDKETTNVRSTSTAFPLKSYDASTGTYAPVGNEIGAKDNDGNAITNLGSSVTVEMSYTKAELAATRSADDASINTKVEADKLTMAYWDTTNQNWSPMSSTVTYKDGSGGVVVAPAADLSNIASVTVAAATSHLSLYAPIVSTNPSAPSTPAGLAAVSNASGIQIDLSWTQVAEATSYDIYRSTSSGGTYTRVGSEPTVGSGSTTSYNDNSGLAGLTTYYYKITAVNASGESASSSSANATTVAGGSSHVSQTPSVTLSVPNGGESWAAGSSHQILWGSGGSGIANVNLKLSTDGGANFSALVASHVANLGYYAWTVPAMSTVTAARIKVEATDSSGSVLTSATSASNFTITGATSAAGGGGGTGATPAAATPVGAFVDTTSTFPAGTVAPTQYSDVEKAAPPTDPVSTGAYNAGRALAATPTIDVDKGILPPPITKTLPCAGGNLIKTSAGSAVYYCGKNGKRYVFPTLGIFASWFTGFGDVKTIAADAMAAIPLAGNVSYKPGVRMVKIQSNPKVYAVSRNGLLRWVKDETVARALYGTEWNKKIDDVDPAFFFTYKIGDSIESAL